jgi:hypothetical protein
LAALAVAAGFGVGAPQARPNPMRDVTEGTVRDCGDACPEIVLVPPGRFLMGSPGSEAGRDLDESPLHEVGIGRGFWVGRYAVTVGEFAAFVKATDFDTGDRCNDKTGLSWRDPGYPVSDTSPVVCVDYADAVAYTTWLSKKTGHRCRLLSEAEYEYADRAGARTAYWWGADVGAGHANCKNCGSLGQQAPGAGGQLRAQPVRALRHQGQRLSVGVRLLEPQVRQRAHRRRAEHARRLHPARPARRRLGQSGRARARRVPFGRPVRQSLRQHGLPRRPRLALNRVRDR